MCLEQRAIALARNILERELEAIKKSEAGERLRLGGTVIGVVLLSTLCFD